VDLLVVWALRRKKGRGRPAVWDDQTRRQGASTSAPQALGNHAHSGDCPLLLAIDCDGTLLNESGKLTDRSAAALKQFASRGGTVVLATGTPARAMKPMAEAVGSSAYVICSSGAVIMSTRGWAPKIQNTIPTGVVVRIVRQLEHVVPPGTQLAVEASDHWYVQSAQFFVELDRAMPGAKLGTRISRLGKIVGEGKLAESFEASGESGAVHILAIHHTMSAEDLMHKLRSTVEDDVKAHRTNVEVKHAGAPRGVAIGSQSVHKAHALQQVCELLQVPPSRVVAFGDNMNDLEMLQWAGTGLAVANAIEPLKQVADRVLEFTNDQDAVAREVEAILDTHTEAEMLRSSLARLGRQVEALEAKLESST